MKTRLIVLVVCLSAVLLASNACARASAPRVIIEKQELVRTTSGAPIAKVTIKNTGQTTAQFTEVNVTFYDTAKNIISTSKDGVMNLKPGETWDFQFLCLAANTFQVKSFGVKVTVASSSRGM